MKPLLAMALFAVTVAVAAAAESLPKLPIDIDGKRFLYQDYLIVTTGMGGVTMHVFVAHADDPKYVDVNLRDRVRFWPSLSTGTVEFPLVAQGVYLVREIGGKMIVDRIAGETPASTDRRVIDAYLVATVKSPPLKIEDN